MSVEQFILEGLKQDAAEDRHEEQQLEDRYNIYVDCLKGSGEYIKSFDEWLNS